MPLRRKKSPEDDGNGRSSKDASPVRRRRQVVHGKVPPDDSSSIETDEDFEKLTSDEINDDKPQVSEKQPPPPQKKAYTNPRGSNFDDMTDKDIYEIQLRNLQIQLEAAVIENSSLIAQVKAYEDITDLKRVKSDLERIKDENKSLREHCREVENRLTHARIAETCNTRDGEVQFESRTRNESEPGRVAAIRNRFQEWKMVTVEKMLDLLSDFSDEPDEEVSQEEDDGEELSVKRLKGNIKRFQAGYRPLVSYIKAVSILLSWKSPSTTFLAFCIYTYCAWKGWLVTLMTGLTVWLLASTYFISRGWNIPFALLPYHLIEEKSEEESQSLSITDKYKLVFHIARKVQNWLGYLADQLEKLHNMIYWGNPESTGTLMKGVVFAFIMSLVFSESWLFFFFALAVGWKLFVLNALYNKFPRFKAKYDTVHLFLMSLPTHAHREVQKLKEEKSQYVAFPPIVDTEESTEYMNIERSPAFCETFTLPAAEYPLPGWEGGKRCTLINKERHLSTAFRHGRLYLTNSHLCFGTSRIHHRKRNMMLSLKDISSVEKAKPFQFIPGHGMSIQIVLFAEEKPYLFSGLLGRDDICREIQLAVEEVGRRAGADEADSSSPSTSASTVDEPSARMSKGEADIFT